MNDVTQAITLVDNIAGSAIVGDRAYDADAFIEHVAGRGMEVVIPSRANRRTQRRHDTHAYRRRNPIERFFGRLKQYRRVATRYDKTGTLLIALSGWR